MKYYPFSGKVVRLACEGKSAVVELSSNGGTGKTHATIDTNHVLTCNALKNGSRDLEIGMKIIGEAKMGIKALVVAKISSKQK